MNPLVIYHYPCQDGFTAAWAVWKAHPDWEFYQGKHGVPPPDVTGRKVFLADFSYKRPVLLEMAKVAKSITIIDHHKTAEADLVDLPTNVEVHFNMDKSGARMAWEFFHPNTIVPELVELVEDRDLWRFKYPVTKAYTAYLFSLPYDFYIWDKINNTGVQYIADQGDSILQKQAKDVEELSVNKFRIKLCDHEGWAVNVPYTYASDMGHLLSKDEEFAATYYFDGSRMKTIVSLRSDENGIDVSDIAKQFGGGGHKHAAGFEVNVMLPPVEFFAYGGI